MARAIKKLHVMGSGFQILPVGNKRLVQSVPGELSMDHAAALQLAQVIAAFTCYVLIQFVIHSWRHCGSQSGGRGNGTTKVFFARS